MFSQGPGSALAWPGPDLMDLATTGPGPGPAEGGPDLKGQGQGRPNQPQASPDLPVDSLVVTAVQDSS